MRIGLSLDDTICRTSEIFRNRIETFASNHHLNPLDIMNDDYLKNEYFDEYLEDIYTNVEVKKNVGDIIKRLRSKGNKIYIITARNNKDSKKIKDVEKLTQDWLERNHIEVDELITSSDKDQRVSTCKIHKIDLMIENNPYNYKLITQAGTECLLFDDQGKYQLKDHYMSTWNDIETYIERNYENEKNN